MSNWRRCRDLSGQPLSDKVGAIGPVSGTNRGSELTDRGQLTEALRRIGRWDGFISAAAGDQTRPVRAIALPSRHGKRQADGKPRFVGDTTRIRTDAAEKAVRHPALLLVIGADRR